MSYENTAFNKVNVLPAETVTANSDEVSAVHIPHDSAIFSHLLSLAHIHALHSIKCIGSDHDRNTELDTTLLSLKNSFSLTEEQLAYLKHFFNVQKEKKQAYIAERFSELEEKVTELAKSRIKDAQDTGEALQAISRLQEVLRLPEQSITEKIERKAIRLTENAFLISVKNLALARLRTGQADTPLSYEDLSEIYKQFEQLELSPRLLERANQIYENSLHIN